MRSKIILVILCFNGFIYCKNENSIKNITKMNRPTFKNFYFFKQGMTTSEVINLLNKNRITHYKIDPLGDKVFQQPVNQTLLTVGAFIEASKKFEVIEGKSLKILNKEIPVFQLGFVNDTLFYFRYESYIEKNDKKENLTDYKIDLKINNDLDLLKDLGDGLKEKHGYPTDKRGNLNSFYPSSEKWHESYYNGINTISFNEYSIWANTDNSIEISLNNFLSRKNYQLSNIEYEKFITQTSISVLFDRRVFNKILIHNNKIDALEKKIEDKKSDSIKANEIQKRKKQLNDL